jgi:hypothetical protein
MIRTPDQRVRVFVSSTLQELASERAAARDAIAQLRLTPVMFELGARPHPPQDLYRSYLEQSHVFVGVYWQSYGWVAPGAAVSGIEDEYDLAGDRPRLIYVKESAAERDPELDRLLDRIRHDGKVSYKPFDTAETLAGLLLDDLALLVSEQFQASDDSGRLSSGTLTFLFADLERSTQLLEELGEAYSELIRSYHGLVEEAVADGGDVSRIGRATVSSVSSPMQWPPSRPPLRFSDRSSGGRGRAGSMFERESGFTPARRRSCPRVTSESMCTGLPGSGRRPRADRSSCPLRRPPSSATRRTVWAGACGPWATSTFGG